jgi:hypothetical protein
MRFRSAILAAMCSATLVTSIALEASGAAALPSKTVPPKKWVHSVCTSINDWKDEIAQGQNLASSLQGATDLNQVKTQVVNYLQSTVDASDQLVTSIGKAGTPSVKNGSKIVKEFKKGFSQIRGVFATARDNTQSLDTSDPTQFASALTNIGTAIQNGSDAIKSTFTAIDTKYHPKAIDRAAKADSACQSISG